MKKNFLAIVLTGALLLSACGSSNEAGNAENSSSSVSGSNSATPSVETSSGLDSSGKITDFYDYATSEWTNSLDPTYGFASFSYDDNVDGLVYGEVFDLFRGKTEKDFPNNPSLQKLVLFFEQLSDNELVNKGADRITSMYDTMENVSSLSEFYKLMATPEYSICDTLFYKDCLITTDGVYVLQYLTRPYASLFSPSEEELSFLEKEFAKEFVLMGENEEEASKKAADAIAFNNMILDFYTSPDVDNDSMDYWTEEKYTSSEHSAPLIDIMKSLDYYKLDHFKKVVYSFFISPGNLDFYDMILKEENLPLLKAFWEVNLFESFFPVGSDEMKDEILRIGCGMSGYPIDKLGDIEFLNSVKKNPYEYNISVCLGVDSGHIAKLYKDTYVSAETISEIEAMADQAKAEYVAMLKESDWLSERVKEKLILKVKKTKIDLGVPDEIASYDDLELGDNPVDTLIAFILSNHEFNKNILAAESGVARYKINFYSSNGYYCSDSNSLLLSFGTIKSLTENSDASYEEKLGIFGSTLTHEFAHSLAPNNIGQGVNGVYMDYITEEENNVIWNAFYTFAESIDGKTADNGGIYNGYRCCYEYFTDVLSVNCSLRILEKMENPDYDAFFTNYARSNAMYMSPTYEDFILRNDGHLLGRTRINALFYQFDKFYEVYDISKKNQYYIAPDKRVTWY